MAPFVAAKAYFFWCFFLGRRVLSWIRSPLSLVSLWLVAMSAPAVAATAPVGATPGSFSVNNNGGANYSVPIVIPPGTAGMVPNLSFSYDRQVDNALLGVGWSIRGLSVIQRCGATIVHDEFKGGVNYDANDRYCLDGQRLMAVNGGVYGGDGTEYRTQQESWIKVVSYGTAGNGPAYFKVWTKDGKVMEYGVTADSRIEAQGKATVRLWALNKVEDTKGNYFTVSYGEDSANGEYWPTRIDYTGNARVSPVLSPYNSVQFFYADRTDIAPRYQGGSVIKVTKRLTNVKTFVAGTEKEVRDYQLVYDNLGAAGRSRLTAITECGADSVCLPSTTFDWQTVKDAGAFDGKFSGYWNGHGGGTSNNATGDFNGDGKTDLAGYTGSGGIWHITIAGQVFPDILSAITDGKMVRTAITYMSLGDASIYSKGNDAVYPYQDVQNAMQVVSGYSTSDGIGGTTSSSYIYSGARTHITGGGWLGFRRIQMVDETTGLRTVTEYSQSYDGTQTLPTYVETARIKDNLVIKSVQNFWGVTSYDGGKRTSAHLDGTIDRAWELDGNPVTHVTTDYTHDVYGNPLTITANSNDGYVRKTTNTYTNDTANWIFGLLTRAQVDSTIPGPVTHTRVSTFDYEAGTGLLLSTTTEPDSVPDVSLTTSYTYDGFGNKLTTTLTGPGIASRTDTVVYDTNGQFITQASNALGHSDAFVYDVKWGVKTSQTGPNGLTTTWSYDGFGRSIGESRADGTTTVIAYANCAVCLANAKYTVTTTATGLAPQTSYYDALGRALRSETQGFDGTVVYKDTEYDNQGRVLRQSSPYFAGQAVQWTSYGYDLLGRVTQVTAPDNSVTTTSYAGRVGTLGFSVSVTNALNQTTTKASNSQGQLVQAIDALGNSMSYTYDPFGNLVQTRDPAGNTTAMAYDIRGRKTGMSDPDMGVWSYAYNALGELTQQIDAKGQVVTMSYDKLGRLISRTEPEGTTTWTYDTALKGVGKPTQVDGPNGYRQTFVYDALGRPSRTQTVVEGDTFAFETTYDGNGRVATVTYPQTGFAIRNTYNGLGYLVDIRDGTTNDLYWQANARNAHGQLTRETLGNGLSTDHVYNDATGFQEAIQTGTGAAIQNLAYQYDAIGNLTSRRDFNQNVTESFAYDALNRLTSATGPASKTYAYDSIGNLTYKSDVGTYTYGPKPHAVASTAGIINASYTYDANGNMTGNGRTISYTSFNKPAQITYNGATSSFAYGADRNRLIKTTATGKTIYISGLYEKVTAGTLVEHKHYIGGVAIHTKRSTGANDTRYLHKDHLGSTDVITDENGVVVERLSFDPHGKRRQADWQDATSTIASVTIKGYTGHEMDDEAGLVNMRARLYDPVLGRFITPDTVIQFPESTQGYNRYSYTDNNPVSRHDVDGHSWWTRHRDRAVLALMGQPGTALMKPYIDKALLKYEAARAVAAIAASIYGGPEGAAAFAAYMTHISGGKPEDIAKAAAIAYLSAETFNYIDGQDWTILQKSAAYGTVGGTRSTLEGGSFGRGFAAYSLAQYSSLRIRTGNLIPVRLGDHAKLMVNKYVAAMTSGGVRAAINGENVLRGVVYSAGAAVGGDFHKIAQTLNAHGLDWSDLDTAQLMQGAISFASQIGGDSARVSNLNLSIEINPDWEATGMFVVSGTYANEANTWGVAGMYLLGENPGGYITYKTAGGFEGTLDLWLP